MLPPTTESEPDRSWHADLHIRCPKLSRRCRSKEQGCGWIRLFQSHPAPVPGGWWKPKRCATAGHKAPRLHCHFQAAPNEMKSSSLFLCHHLCHIIPQRSTPSSQKGFLLKYINLSSLSCHYSNWDLMYLPLLLSPSLPPAFYWYRVVLASVSICPFPHMSDRQSAVSKTYHLCSGVLDH